MRLIVARVEPPPPRVATEETRRALMKLDPVEHVYIRDTGDVWQVGIFVRDDGLHQELDRTEGPVREVLRATLAGPGSRFEIHSEFLDEAPGRLLQ